MPDPTPTPTSGELTHEEAEGVIASVILEYPLVAAALDLLYVDRSASPATPTGQTVEETPTMYKVVCQHCERVTIVPRITIAAVRHDTFRDVREKLRGVKQVAYVDDLLDQMEAQ